MSVRGPARRAVRTRAAMVVAVLVSLVPGASTVSEARSAAVPAVTGRSQSHATQRILDDLVRAGAPGVEIVSTTTDVNRFISALLAGRLLPAAVLRTMLAPTFAGGQTFPYGLGIEIWATPCGVTAYGHVGDVSGSRTHAAAVLGGHRSYAFNQNDDYVEDDTANAEMLRTVFCPRRDSATHSGPTG